MHSGLNGESGCGKFGRLRAFRGNVAPESFPATVITTGYSISRSRA